MRGEAAAWPLFSCSCDHCASIECLSTSRKLYCITLRSSSYCIALLCFAPSSHLVHCTSTKLSVSLMSGSSTGLRCILYFCWLQETASWLIDENHLLCFPLPFFLLVGWLTIISAAAGHYHYGTNDGRSTSRTREIETDWPDRERNQDATMLSFIH